MRFTRSLAVLVLVCATGLSTPALATERIDPGRQVVVSARDIPALRSSRISHLQVYRLTPAVARSEVRAIIRDDMVGNSSAIAVDSKSFGSAKYIVGASTPRGDLGDRPADGNLTTLGYGFGRGMMVAGDLPT